MITLIVYVSQDDVIDSDYERILLLEERRGNIVFLHTRYDNFEKNPGEIYKDVSDKMGRYGTWKMIFVDDSRYLCSNRKEGCYALCSGGRDYYENYRLKDQIAVFSGDANDSSYTAGVPSDLFVILTRGDKEPCLYDICAVQGENCLCTNYALPAHGRYLVFDFFGKGDYLREEKEWQLFFLLWILAQENVTTDCFLPYQIYKVSINWMADDLQSYLEEMAEQLQKLRNQINNMGLYSPRNATVDYQDNTTGDFKGYSAPQIKGRKIINGMRGTVEELIYQLEQKQNHIETEARRNFKIIRQLDWEDTRKVQKQNYEEVLESHYNAGNVNYKHLEKGLKSIMEKIVAYEKEKGGLLGIILELIFIIGAVSVFWGRSMNADQEIIPCAALCMVMVILVFFVISKIYVKGRGANSKWEFEELLEEADQFLNDKIDRINSQFHVMVKYKSYVTYKNRMLKRKRDRKKEDEGNRKNREELERAEAFLDRIKKFAKQPISQNWDHSNFLSEKEDWFFYPQGWEKRGNICKVLERNVICPYYFIRQVNITAEQRKKEDENAGIFLG